VPALVAGLAVTTLIAAQGPDARDLGQVLVAMAAASAAGAALLGALFLLVSLIIPRALLAGMIYIFAWESLLGRFLPGVRAISSREHALRVFDGVLGNDFPTASNAALTMLVVAVVCLLLAVWRLRTIQVN
jgi:ABC-2 type transport system permease protein